MPNGRRKQAALVKMVLILAALLLWNAPPEHAQSFSPPTQENVRIVPGDEIDHVSGLAAPSGPALRC